MGAYSRGLRQRLGIPKILIKEPRIASLDEPTLGLNPEGTTRIIDYIQSLSRESNITKLLSFHDLKQVQKIAHRIGHVHVSISPYSDTVWLVHFFKERHVLKSLVLKEMDIQC